MNIQLLYEKRRATLLALAVVVVSMVTGSVLYYLATKPSKQPTEITLSIAEVDKKINDFTVQRNQLIAQVREVQKWLNQTPEQDKQWLDTLKIQQKNWVNNAMSQIEQTNVVLNTLNAIKTDSSVRAK